MNRDELYDKLVEIVGEGFQVYFQPPANITLKYPCVVFSYGNVSTQKADNLSYLQQMNYDIVVITKSPDLITATDIIKNLKYTTFERVYIADNYYHYALTHSELI